jgi:hypothetical protein
MVADDDTSSMFAIIFLIGIFVVCLVAPFYSADSRFDETPRHRANL